MADGQCSRYLLVVGEQFGLGGADSVRGFREHEVLGDDGYCGSAELYTPDFGRAGISSLVDNGGPKFIWTVQ